MGKYSAAQIELGMDHQEGTVNLKSVKVILYLFGMNNKAMFTCRTQASRVLFMMDTLFWASKSRPPLTVHYKAWKSQDILFIQLRLYSSERRKSYTLRMAWE